MVFNLIVGAGALAMPQAFSESGIIGGSLLLAVLAFLSFVSVSFMVEAMSITNALKRATAQGSKAINVSEHEVYGCFQLSLYSGRMSEGRERTTSSGYTSCVEWCAGGRARWALSYCVKDSYHTHAMNGP